VTIRDIEKKTSLNFLSGLDEKVQEVVENKKAKGGVVILQAGVIMNNL